ncbi:MAG TPA: phenylalanine--tRNA ligase subunit beta [Candidatus Avimonas sp.]|jgi:phenylalanyl-tRNA synthetase beta chain|nr:phenylalanine--tRNA ligase subunit beta [Clostridiales bacterium]HOB37146.1 phenylalanine--tRNA ligase subunit beta [Candidatus Avimonas sp.]HQA16558.1 phenylalanine--tRNA ligase subunit beta [Candidatus Avimonas sp.]HQD38589.1 phenylalanine--tRNA ligase subunit beta [Candidatus Avimonas sp.]
MKVSLNWLRRYVDIPVSVEELCDKMLQAGFEVESVEDLSKSMENVVVGRIERMEKHPNADRLQVCRVDVGAGEPVQVVTGAGNVFEGALVPVALHGSRLPNGMQIKKGELRGVESLGMLCSGQELCLKESDYRGAEADGILILLDDYPPGTDMRAVLGLDDVIIDFSVTANRPDCQSILGIAREVSVVLKTEFKKPAPLYKTKGGDINSYISVEVRDYELCPRYFGRVVTNVRIGPSPDGMQKFLKACGMRPINNIVDITNFVLLETGQPMHAFDLRDVRGHRIIVRRAENGEKITTLDGKEHTLSPEMLVIADAERPSCLAGIMGGLDSEIKDDTTEIFFESAKFRRDSVRHTARTLGVRTESSARFEKGTDIYNVEYAMERALSLIYELGVGDIVEGVIDCNDGLPQERVLKVTVSGVNSLLGLEIPGETMVEILNRLSIKTSLSGNTLTCVIPSFRDDIEGRADIAEEVMRIYGYHHIVGTPMKGLVVRGRKSHERLCGDRIKNCLVAQGLHEIATYSFISEKALDILGIEQDDPRRRAIRILNPLGEEYSVMRTQLVYSMLNVMSINYSRKIPAVRFFELSKVFVPDSVPITKQPEERPALSIGLYGEQEDFFTLKGIVEAVLAEFNIVPEYQRSGEPHLHPGRQAAAVADGRAIAVFGEVHPDTSEKFGFNNRVYVAEIRADILMAAKKPLAVYKPLPRFPAIERDLALVCDVGMPVAEIEKVIREHSGEYLESVQLFDVYQGTQIEKGKKSVAYRLVFRSPEFTLKDEDVEPAMNRVIEELSGKGCYLRS